MRRTLTCTLILLGCAGCQGPRPQDGRPVVLNDPEQVAHHLGELVTIQGRIVDDGVPLILGVEVDPVSPAEIGAYAEATGVLYRWRVTPEAFAATQVMGDLMTTRRPGLHYRIVDPGQLAVARPVRFSPTGPRGDDPSADNEIVEESLIEIDD